MANNNNKDKCNVPHLRFPEFSGEWKKCTIGELAIKVGSGVTPRGGESVYKTNGYPFVRSQNVGLGHLILDDIAFIDEETHLRQKSTELKLEDVLLNITGASIGRSALVNEQVVGGNVNQHVCIIRTKENLISSFLCNFLLSNYGQRQIDSFQAGGNRQGLNFEQIKSIKIAIPSTKEQTKVAKLLQLIEERIATQNKIIDKLQSLIKGLPHRIAKLGLQNTSWEKTLLANVLTERKELNTELHSVFSVSVSEGVINQIEYLGRSFAAKDTSNYHVAHYGDIIYTKSPTGDFPYGIIKQSHIESNVAISPLYGVYIPISFEIGVYLHYYFMSAVSANNYLYSLVQKGAKNTINISNQRFLENRVPVPIIRSKIRNSAKALIAIQKKLSLEKKTLASLIAQKNHLLQQMFI